MTTPLYPNPIGVGDVEEEFGSVSGIVNMGSYYRGGPNVPNGAIGYPYNVATPIPASGALALSNFWGATKAPPPRITMYRFTESTDRYGTFRFYMNQVWARCISASSRTTGLIWVQLLRNVVPVSQLDGSVATLQILGGGPNAYRVTHQATAAQPYVDVLIDDNASDSHDVAQFYLHLQLAPGRINPEGPYLGALPNNGSIGRPVNACYRNYPWLTLYLPTFLNGTIGQAWPANWQNYPNTGCPSRNDD